MRSPTRQAQTLIKASRKTPREDSELRYRRLFETAQDGILILDGETGRIEDVNPYLIKLLGYSRAEFVKKKLWEVGAFKDIKASRLAFRALQKKEYIRYEDLPLKTKGGGLIEVEFVSNVYLVGGKKVIQCEIRDITEHRRIIAALQRNEQKYHDLVNQSPDGMFILELSGRMITVNESMCRGLGFSKKQFLAKKIWDLVPKQYLSPYRASLKRIFDGRSLDEAGEYAIQGKDGELHYVQVMSAPHYSGKDVIGYYGIAYDVTARKRAEEDLASLARFPSENPNPVLRLRGDGVVLYANAASEALLAMWKCVVGGPAPKVWRELAAQTISSGENKTVDLECGGKLYSMYAAPISRQDYIDLYGRDVTEQKKAEAALRATEERFRSLVENAPDAIAVIAPDGALLYDSPAAPRLLGYDVGELTGHNVLGMIHPDDVPRVTSLIKEIVQDSSVRANSLFRFHHKDGSWRWVEAAGKNLLGESSVGGLVINYRDVTDRMQAQEMLAAERDLLTTLIDHLPDNIFVKDLMGHIVIDNDAHRGLLGAKTLKQVVGKTDFDFFPAELAAQFAADEERVVQSGEAMSERVERVLDKDHAEKWLLTTKVPVRDRQGKITGIVGINRDITERKRAEDALQASEHLLNGIINTIPVRVFWKDKDSVYLGCNTEFARDAGFADPADIIGKDDCQIGRAEQAQSYRKDDLQVITSNQTKLDIEESMTTADGKVLTVLTSKMPLRSPQRAVTGVLGMYVDISARRQGEQALAASESELRALFASMRDAVFVIDRDGYYRKVAPTNPDVWYIDPHELLGKRFQDILPAQAELFAAAIQQVLDTKQTRRIEYELTFEGQSVWYEASISPMSADSTLWVARDITERRRAEVVLRLSEARFSQLAQASFEGIAIHDNRKILEANQPLADLFGYQVSEMLGMNPLDLAAPESRKLVQKNMLAGLESSYEATGRRKDGTTFEGELLSKSASYEGATARATAIRDITARKQAALELRSRNEEVSALYALSRDLANAADLGEVLELVNRNAVESLHVTFARIALLDGPDLVTRAAYPVRILDHDLFVGDRRPITALPHCQRTLQHDESVILHSNDPEIHADERAALLLDLAQSLYLVPLAVRPEEGTSSLGMGILMLGEARSDEREAISPAKMRLAESLADQAATAIRRMLLRDEGRRRMQQVDALHAIDTTITGSTDLRMILNVILQHVTDRLGVDAAAVLLLNPHTQILEYAAARGFRTSSIENSQVRLGQPYAGRVALDRHLVQIPDLSADPQHFFLTGPLADEGFVCYYGVPLMAKGQVKGVLEIFNRAPLKTDAEWFEFLNALAGQAAIAIDNSTLLEGLQRSNYELRAAYDATIEGWSHALDLRDKETEGHTQRVTDMAVKLARSFGLTETELVQVRWGSLLHDIGKMGVPDSILLKPGPLTDEEWAVMKKHPTFAYEMLAPIRYLRLALDIPYGHHEKWDGSGYPRGLRGEQIPLTARIFAVVDVWDALNSDRPYRQAWSAGQTLHHILSQSGKHFDPAVVEAFSTMLAADGLHEVAAASR